MSSVPRPNPEPDGESSTGGPAGHDQPGPATPSLYHHDVDATTTVLRLPPRRPAEVWAGAVFLTLAALPVMFLGAVLALLPGQAGANLRQKITDAGTSMDVETLVTLFRAAGAVLLIVGALFVVLAWLAARPRRRARTAVTVLVVIEVALLVFAMVVAVPDPVSVGVLLLALAGAVLLYLPRSDEFIRHPR